MAKLICIYTLYFFFYSAVGWLGESIYCSIGERKLINRGFLTGPMCPIYGTGTLVLSVCLYKPFYDKPIIVFFLGILLCDIVEYFTSYIMEKLFNARWWDYTEEFLNLHGRICLKHSIYWGLASVAFVRLVHKHVERWFSLIPDKYVYIITAVVLFVFLIDVINAVRKALDVRKLSVKIQKFTAMIEENAVQFISTVSGKFDEIQFDVEKTSERFTDKRRYAVEQIMNTISDLESKLFSKSKESRAYRQLYNNPFLRDNIKGKLETIKKHIQHSNKEPQLDENANDETIQEEVR